MSNDIQIIDVIVKYSPYGGHPHYYVVTDREPVYVYEQKGHRLTAHDSGFYDFLGIEPGSKDAFAGREFEINLSDGSTYKCHGQVWSCGPGSGIEPVLSVGVRTIEGLRKCYVFSSSNVSKTKLEAWLAVNKPSGNYYKYDPCYTVEWLDSLYSKESWDKPVCAQRARKLRKKGVTIRRSSTGQRGWSPVYERRKAEILEMQELMSAFDIEAAKRGEQVEYNHLGKGWIPCTFLGLSKKIKDIAVVETDFHSSPIVTTFKDLRMSPKKIKVRYRVGAYKDIETSEIRPFIAGPHDDEVRWSGSKTFVEWLTDWQEAEVEQ